MSRKDGQEEVQKAVRKAGNRELKDLLREFTVEEFDGFVKEYRKLNKRQRCETYIKVLKYVLPTISAIKFEDAGSASSASELLHIAAKYKNENK